MLDSPEVWIKIGGGLTNRLPYLILHITEGMPEMLAQAVGYAAAALGCLASREGKPLLVKEIAEACGIPQAYLAKIVNVLARRGLVNTQRGIGGGVALARPAEAITLFDLCEALGDPIVQPRCMLENAPCSDERSCPAHRFWTAHREEQIAFLRSTTVAAMAEFTRRQRSPNTPG